MAVYRGDDYYRGWWWLTAAVRRLRKGAGRNMSLEKRLFGIRNNG